MNRQIVQLFGLVRAAVRGADRASRRAGPCSRRRLTDNPANRRPLIEEQKIPRGLILARRRHRAGAQPRARRAARTARYTRTYPTGRPVRPPGRLLVHHERPARARASRNDDLVGQGERVRVDPVAAREPRPRGQRRRHEPRPRRAREAALHGLAGRKGAVVAIEPSTGKVRVMVSIPEYDPNLIPSQFGQLNTRPPTSRSSTARRRSATRPARPSRS